MGDGHERLLSVSDYRVPTCTGRRTGKCLPTWLSLRLSRGLVIYPGASGDLRHFFRFVLLTLFLLSFLLVCGSWHEAQYRGLWLAENEKAQRRFGAAAHVPAEVTQTLCMH